MHGKGDYLREHGGWLAGKGLAPILGQIPFRRTFWHNEHVA